MLFSSHYSEPLKAMASAVSEKIRERRNRVLLGPLPEDFLRLNISPQEQQEAADRQAALALQQHYSVGVPIPSAAGRLSITLVQAKLVKNYGMTRMDPYCRLRIGHVTYETPTDPNGGKNPRWNKVIYCLIPQGIRTMNIEIFDERSFTMDELVGWAQIDIPQRVFAGETHEDWYPLSGKQGEGVEGTINLVLSYNSGSQYYQPCNPIMIVPRADAGGVKPLKVSYTQNNKEEGGGGGGEPPRPAPPVFNETDLKQIEEMFPNIEKDVIRTVYEANRFNKDSTVNSLLQMAD